MLLQYPSDGSVRGQTLEGGAISLQSARVDQFHKKPRNGPYNKLWYAPKMSYLLTFDT
ncbi:MAG: hypothetical protein KI791_16835 [Cyclobacteriaceae bacterium]|nr:hypothetical protein [Cyclobacteriaceae bacterium SS2]